MSAFTPITPSITLVPITYGSHPLLNGSVRYGGNAGPSYASVMPSAPGAFAGRTATTGSFTHVTPGSTGSFTPRSLSGPGSFTGVS